eukprot:4193954-Amphidinium_carterae.1
MSLLSARFSAVLIAPSAIRVRPKSEVRAPPTKVESTRPLDPLKVPYNNFPRSPKDSKNATFKTTPPNPTQVSVWYDVWRALGRFPFYSAMDSWRDPLRQMTWALQ